MTIVCDSLGDDYPTFPAFVRLLREYERDLAAERRIYGAVPAVHAFNMPREMIRPTNDDAFNHCAAGVVTSATRVPLVFDSQTTAHADVPIRVVAHYPGDYYSGQDAVNARYPRKPYAKPTLTVIDRATVERFLAQDTSA